MKNNSPWVLNGTQLKAREKFVAAIDEGTLCLEKRNVCICGSMETTVISDIDRFGLPFCSYICEDCGLIFTSPHIANESLSTYYNEYYHPLTFGTEVPVDNLVSVGQGEKIYNIVSHYLSTEDIRVFEVGAGSGSTLFDFVRAAYKSGKNVEACGIEYNVEYVGAANSKGVKLYSESLEDFLSRNLVFDVIILSHVLEHFVAPREVIMSLLKMTHEKSIFYIEVPGVMSLKKNTTYRNDLKKYLTHAHTFNFNLNSLVSFMSVFRLKLICGNEIVESVFSYDRGLEKLNDKNNYDEMINYLHDLELINEKFYNKIINIGCRLKSFIKSFIG